MLKKSISFCGVSAHKFALEVIDINFAAKLLQRAELCFFILFFYISGIQYLFWYTMGGIKNGAASKLRVASGKIDRD